MPRVTVAPTVEGGAYNYSGVTVAWSAADPVNLNQASFDEGAILLARNVGATGRSVTVTSAADAQGRTRDITAHAVAAGAVAAFGPFKRHGWVQTDGFLYFEGNHAEVQFAYLRRGT